MRDLAIIGVSCMGIAALGLAVALVVLYALADRRN